MESKNTARMLVDRLLTETGNVAATDNNNEWTESKNLEKFTLGQEELNMAQDGNYMIVDTKGVKVLLLDCSVSVQMGTVIFFQMKKGKNVPIFIVPPNYYVLIMRVDENGNPDYVAKTL